jgi:hypothetical protein
MTLAKTTSSEPKTTKPTTTLRVPSELRDEIARIAERRGTSMLEVVSDAVHRLQLDDWWSSVHSALDALGPSDVTAYRADANRLDSAAMDGMGD